MSTYEFDTGGVERLVGQLKAVGGATGDVPTQQANGQLSQAPGGGGSMTQREYVVGNNVVIANGATEPMTWDTKSSGDDLLDLVSDPTQPSILVDGVYAVFVDILSANSLTVGGGCRASLLLDANGEDVFLGQSAPALGGFPSALSLSGVWYLEAGAVLYSEVINADGAVSRTFALTGYVQRLS